MLSQSCDLGYLSFIYNMHMDSSLLVMLHVQPKNDRDENLAISVLLFPPLPNERILFVSVIFDCLILFKL